MAQDIEIPKWINKEIFCKMLSQLNKGIDDIKSFNISRALASGENYSTLMLRVQIKMKLKDGSAENCSFMLKLPYETKEMKDMLASLNFFHLENVVYNDVLNEMEKMYKEVGVELRFGAKCHRLPLDNEKLYLLLEDLNCCGFKNVNRLEGLDMEHTECILRKLALFHAASACKVATLGPYPEKLFLHDLDNEYVRTKIKQMYVSMAETFMKNLRNYKNCEKYRESLLTFFNNLIGWFVKARTVHTQNFNVLNHGDMWNNNILFKYKSDGHVEETYFVDYQNCNYGPPVQDLYVLIFSSVHMDYKLKNFDYFIEYYYKYLVENLKLLKYPLVIMSLQELQEQLKVYGGWAFLTCFFLMGVTLLDPTDEAKFEYLMRDTPESKDFQNLIYSNPRYIQCIEEILPWLHERDLMDPKNLLKSLNENSSSKLQMEI
uniref:CHK domain-containing protein n=1 Tax=Glossina brevipalpis TaxID=37001 RepID=A0A1A9WJF7_9MUSC